jgi:hypothetical protein
MNPLLTPTIRRDYATPNTPNSNEISVNSLKSNKNNDFNSHSVKSLREIDIIDSMGKNGFENAKLFKYILRSYARHRFRFVRGQNDFVCTLSHITNNSFNFFFPV